MAAMFPERTFVGIDKMLTVLAKGAAGSVEQNLPNVMFIAGDIAYIAPKFPEHRIDHLFLNFSDPWPRRRHYERRLTHESKLQLYQKLLHHHGVVEQKTDNRDLFEWSVTSFEQHGWTLERIERDFAAQAPDPSNLSSQYVQTEYEAKFRAAGQPIYYLKARPPVSNSTGAARASS